MYEGGGEYLDVPVNFYTLDMKCLTNRILITKMFFILRNIRN